MFKKILAGALLLASTIALAANLPIATLPLGTGAGVGTQDSLPYYNVTASQPYRIKLDDLPNVPAFQTEFQYLDPMTTVGDLIYNNSSLAPARLAGNTTTNKEFLCSTGTGTAATAPVWCLLQSTDIPNNTANTTGSAGSLTQSLTSGSPVIGNGTGIGVGTKSGTTTDFITGTGTLTGIGCAQFNSSGDLTNTGSACGSGGGGTPGGSSGQVQYNSSGSFAGSSGMTYNGTNLTLANILNANGGIYDSGWTASTPACINSSNDLVSCSYSGNTTKVATTTGTLTNGDCVSIDSHGNFVDNGAACGSGGSGVSAVGTYNTQTSSSNGAVISGTSIYFQPFTSANPGMAPASGGGTSNFLRADGTWAAPSGSGFSNPMTTLGDIIYGGASGTATRLAGNTAATRQFLISVGTGSAAQAPSYSLLQSGDIPNNAANTSGSAGSLSQSLTSNAVILGAGTGVSAIGSLGTSGQPLISAGASSPPAFGTLGYAGGGTNATTQAAAQANMSPMTTKGDTTIYASSPARHAVPGDYGRLIPDTQQTDGWRTANYYQFQDGRPGKNYIQYADFENNATTGWSLGTTGSLTNGLPTGTPAFGSGASGNLSLASESSSPLAGSYSLGYVSSAATTVGNMVATSSLPIDSEDQAKVLTVKFYYGVSSGASNVNASASSSNSYAWAVYDVTNSVWLSSAGNFCMNQTNMGGYCTGTFQTGATTANIRLVVYNANATAGAATLYLDDFYVGPQTAPIGPAMTDWVAYTPTFAGFGTVSNVTAYSRRVGANLEGYVLFEAGTPTGSTAQITLGYNGGNANVSIGSYLAGGQVVGTGTSNYSSTTYFAVYPIATSGNNYLNLSLQSSTTSSASAAVGTALAVSGTYLSFQYSVPITGWSSNSTQSSDTDTRVVAMEVNQSAPSVTVSSSASIVIYNSPSTYSDTHGGYNKTTGNYTVPVTGYYRVTSQNLFAGTFVAGSQNTTFIEQNGTSVISNISFAGGASGFVTGGATGTIYCHAGDTLAPYVSSTGTSVSISNAGGAAINYFMVERLTGPAVVTATESVNGRYYGSSSTISSTAANITFSTKSFDTHNAYSSGTLTIPVSGKYQFNVSVLTTGTISTNESAVINLNKNGTTVSTNIADAGGVVSFIPVNLSDLIQCNAGDQITIQVSSTASSPSIYNSIPANTFFTWSRVGN